MTPLAYACCMLLVHPLTCLCVDSCDASGGRRRQLWASGDQRQRSKRPVGHGKYYCDLLLAVSGGLHCLLCTRPVPSDLLFMHTSSVACTILVQITRLYLVNAARRFAMVISATCRQPWLVAP